MIEGSALHTSAESCCGLDSGPVGARLHTSGFRPQNRSASNSETPSVQTPAPSLIGTLSHLFACYPKRTVGARRGRRRCAGKILYTAAGGGSMPGRQTVFPTRRVDRVEGEGL